jgi:hypothetical protein
MSDQILRNKDGTFAKGSVPNPMGKPPGTESKVTKLRKMIAERVPDVIEAMLDAAIHEHDTQAAKLLLERCLPPFRGESMPVEIPAMQQTTSLVEIGRSVLSAIGEGLISPEIGVQVLSSLANQSKLVENEELEKRIEQLEESASIKQDQQENTIR